jgi:diaminohydroxyphosphoribosylaminopyrimidine deaminase/5-amino-6-(5-phosphoribosylamino)uracil reductase
VTALARREKALPTNLRVSTDDEKWMRRALELARRGEALTSPNPMVGAVLVRNGRIVSEGFHTYDGLRHAEIVALDAAGPAAKGAIAYVNLEPCCHTGRTGPCSRALIDAKVARVVGGMTDPNPQVAGQGYAELRRAGIEVIAGVLENEAQRLNEAFSTWVTRHRPFVTLKSAMTLDGHLVLPRGRGSRGKEKIRWITSEASRAEVQRMRHASDALLTGIGTVLIDDPLLTDRTGLPRRRPLLRVILDSRLRLSPRSQIVRSAKSDVLVFTCESASSKRAQALRNEGIEILECAPAKSASRNRRATGRQAQQPDLREVLAELARRDILSVMLEAGATLNEAALSAGVVDKLRLFYAPIYAGKASAATPKPRLLPSAVDTVSDVRIERFGPDFAVEAYLRTE